MNISSIFAIRTAKAELDSAFSFAGCGRGLKLSRVAWLAVAQEQFVRLLLLGLLLLGLPITELFLLGLMLLGAPDN